MNDHLCSDFFALPFFAGTDTVILECCFPSSLQEKTNIMSNFVDNFFYEVVKIKLSIQLVSIATR